MNCTRSVMLTLGTAICLVAVCVPGHGIAGEVTGAAKAADGATHAVIFDMTKIVHLRAQRGWSIDRHELKGLLPDALMSVCLVPKAVANDAEVLLRARIVALGGPLKKAWENNGKSLDRLDELVVMSRAADLLRLAIASRADCPFHMLPVDDFVARHADAGHITVNVEGGGLFSFRRIGTEWRLGGGGAGRLTVGWGISPRWAIRAGPELGGAALVDEKISADSLDVNFFGAVPITIRRLTPTWNYDFELAPLGLGIPWQEELRYGFRVGVLMGVSYLRVRSLLPWGGFAVNFEYVLPRGNQPGQWTVRSGLRVGFNLRAFRP